MLNQIVLVGRLTKDIEVHDTESGKKIASVVLAIPRSFKNMDGVYDTDFIECKLWDLVATNTAEYCHKGDIVGLKGRVQSRTIEDEDKRRTIIEVIAEKVTFLSSKREEKEGKEEKEEK